MGCEESQVTQGVRAFNRWRPGAAQVTWDVVRAERYDLSQHHMVVMLTQDVTPTRRDYFRAVQGRQRLPVCEVGSGQGLLGMDMVQDHLHLGTAG